MENRRMEKEIEKCLEQGVGTTVEEFEVREDFRKLVVRWECTAGKATERCVFYSPGGDGRCSLQQEVGELLICRSI